MEVRVDYVPAGKANRPGLPFLAGRPLFITVHETANNDAGANAFMHRWFVHGGGGSDGVSFHWVVDDKQAWALIPETERAWHAGDGVSGPGNGNSLAVELCVNEDADWDRMMRNAAQLVGVLAWRHMIAPERIVQHHHWRATACPAWLRGTGLWDEFFWLAKGWMALLNAGRP